MNQNYIAQVEQDPETQELVLVFPDKLIEQLGWQVGDDIQWHDNGNGSFTLTRKTKEQDAS